MSSYTMEVGENMPFPILPACDEHTSSLITLPGQGHLGKSHLDSFHQGNKAEKLEYMVSNARQDLGADAGCLSRQDAFLETFWLSCKLVCLALLFLH